MSNEETLARWAAFIEKIRVRLEEVLAEGDAGFRELIAADPADAQSFGNAMSGMRFRVEPLIGKIGDTWTTVIDKLDGGKAVDRGIEMMEDAQDQLGARWQRWGVGWEADFYRNMWPLAQAAMQKPIHCVKCGGPLAKKGLPTAAETLGCPACGAQNNVFPEAVVGSYFGGCAHTFASHATLDKRLAIDAHRRQADRWRRARDWADEPIESLRQWEAMERDYWTSYFAVQAQYDAMPPEQQKQMVESRMKPLYEYSLQTLPAWRKAHGMPVRG